MKFTRFLLSVLLMGAASAPAFAADPASVDITVSTTTGTITAKNAGGTWGSAWTATAATGVPSFQITIHKGNNLAAVANNIDIAKYNAGNFIINGGDASSGTSCVLTMTPEEGWYVSAYKFDAKITGAAMQITTQTTTTALTTEYQHFEQTIAATDEPLVKIFGGNNPVQFDNFVVTLTKIDEAAIEALVPFTPTTITNGEFAADTKWYNMAISQNFYLLSYPGEATNIALSATGTKTEDIYSWCFVHQDGGGYRIYNKAAGTGRALGFTATPSDGTACQVLPSSNASYLLDWEVVPEATHTHTGAALNAAFNGKHPMFLHLKGNANSYINNFGSVLKVWSAGHNDGSVLTVTEVNPTGGEIPTGPDPFNGSIEIKKSNGSITLDNGGAYWNHWTSTNTNPQLKVILCKDNGTEGAANGYKTAYDNNGDIIIYGGNTSPFRCTINLEVSEGWYVAGYSFGAATTASGLKIYVQGQETALTSAVQSFSAELQEGEAVSLKVGGANQPTTFTNFIVYIKQKTGEVVPPVEPDPVEKTLPFATTTITNGQFAADTEWYNFALSTNNYFLHSEGTDAALNLDATSMSNLDKYQWCFVKDENSNVTIYNKADGPTKALASPANPTDGGYPRMVAVGTSGYIFDWVVDLATQYKDGNGNITDVPAAMTSKGSFFIHPVGFATAIPNRYANGSLMKFWTGGYNNSSIMYVSKTQGTINVIGQNGTFANPSGIWTSSWTSTGSPTLTVSHSKNNMSSTEAVRTNSAANIGSGNLVFNGFGGITYSIAGPAGFYISDFEATFAAYNGKGPVSFSLNGGETFTVQGAETKVISLHDLEIGDFPGQLFVSAATNDNDHRLELRDCKVTIKFHTRDFDVEHITNQIPTNKIYVFDTAVAGYGDWTRRIPAITTVGKGTHEGRLVAWYDHRPWTGDIGLGNVELEQAYSDDNGATWSTPDYARDAVGDAVSAYNHYWRTAQSNRGTWTNYVDPETGVESHAAEAKSHSNDAWDSSFGDAAICADRESGKVLVMACGGPLNFFDGRRANPNQCARWISNDGGDTYSEAQRYTEKILSLFDGETDFGKGYIDSQFIGSGRMMQSRYVKVGDYYRIYAVIGSQVGGGNVCNWVIYTDDMGETWNILGGKDGGVAVRGIGDECKAEELPDGTVMIDGRTGGRNFNFFRYTNVSTGEGKWLTNITTDMGMGSINACDGEIYIIPVRNKATQEVGFMAFKSFPFGGGRANVSVAWKPLFEATDFCKPAKFMDWNGRFLVHAGASVYSTMTLDKNGDFSFFYEGGVGQGIVCTLTVEEITGDKYEYIPDFGNEISFNLTKEMAKYRAENYFGPNKADVDAAYEAFKANPSYANYIGINIAEYGEPSARDGYDFDYANSVIWPGAEVVEPTKPVESATISSESAALKVGETLTLTLAYEPADAEPASVEWISSNETVATVTDGVVTAVAAGNAVITVVINDEIMLNCAITVTEPIQEDSIQEISNTQTLEHSNTYDLLGRRVTSPRNGLYIQNGRKVRL